MKPTQKHFEIFQKECLRLIDKFRLDNWNVYFELGTRKSVLATTSRHLGSYMATITLHEGWGGIAPLTVEEIHKTAKHEVTHLLLSRLALNAGERHVTTDDLIESEEELVNKLSRLL